MAAGVKDRVWDISDLLVSLGGAMKIIDHGDDWVFVEPSSMKDRLKLRIAPPTAGKTRWASLRPTEARIIAYALLAGAERLDMGEEPKEPHLPAWAVDCGTAWRHLVSHRAPQLADSTCGGGSPGRLPRLVVAVP
jgi:hypothetical protein